MYDTKVFVAFILISVLLCFALRQKLSTIRNRSLIGLDITISSQGPLSNPSLFPPSNPKPIGYNYTRILVTGHLPSEDISWIHNSLPNLPTKIYAVNTTTTSLPANKGHEAMIYLTYIIEHYPHFPDVVLFMHPHEKAWHIDPVHEQSNVLTVQRLLDDHVVRQGYFNTRCVHFPGCPRWLTVDQWWWRYNAKLKPEERYLTGKLWRDLHGFDGSVSVPTSISQPCCAQFAVSGERLRQRGREEYVRYRDWLLKAELRDSMTGRLFEYSWQWLFAGVWEFCPSLHQCYCDGYGVCFERKEEGVRRWLEIWEEKKRVDEKMRERWDKGRQHEEAYFGLMRENDDLQEEMGRMTAEAIKRGKDPRLRAEECGRVWTGDSS